MKITVESIKLNIENFVKLFLHRKENDRDTARLKVEVDTPQVHGETEVDFK